MSICLKNIVLKVNATDNLSIAVIPSNEIDIPILGVGEKRVITYDVSLIGSAPEGNYTINIVAQTPGKIYKEEIVWEVKNA